MDAALETYQARDFALWPVAPPRPDGVLLLSGGLSPLEVGTAMAVWAGYNHDLDPGDPRAADAGALLWRTVEAECTIAPGGLCVRDTVSGALVRSGCCCGLETWREWLDLADGAELWLGHDPSPRVEHLGSVVRIWPDGRDAAHTPVGRPVELAVAELPGLLEDVQGKLRGFLGLARQWAERHAPPLARALVDRLDTDWSISAPLCG
ncbi:hypothetical protein [Streptomyces sp. ME19-01-6]|uniref:hypothetical protein n=1 Tax=Streptomyces sp. ME19-01-6 TaxID=3028686 RepID=UPI0029A1DCF3|nr:hypothetical protein [Streptomyces sp. ME19-01-6]MDX3226148.1 hypothetical protein [Streptomyces sp. ME19-01-6]